MYSRIPPKQTEMNQHRIHVSSYVYHVYYICFLMFINDFIHIFFFFRSPFFLVLYYTTNRKVYILV